MRKIYDVDISILSKSLRKGSINIIDKIETVILCRKRWLELYHKCKITNVSIYNYMPFLQDYESHIDYGNTDQDNYYKHSYNINWDFVSLGINKIVPRIITNVVTIIYIDEITLLPVWFDRIGFSNGFNDDIYNIDAISKWSDRCFYTYIKNVERSFSINCIKYHLYKDNIKINGIIFERKKRRPEQPLGVVSFYQTKLDN